MRQRLKTKKKETTLNSIIKQYAIMRTVTARQISWLFYFSFHFIEQCRTERSFGNKKGNVFKIRLGQ